MPEPPTMTLKELQAECELLRAEIEHKNQVFDEE
jgi:hypothetical protein